MKPNHRVTIRLSAAEYRQLVELSAELNLTQSEAVRSCIATCRRKEDLLAELQAIRAEIDLLRAANERLAKTETERILLWLKDHVSV